MQRAAPLTQTEADILRDLEADPAFPDCDNSPPTKWLQGELRVSGLGLVEGRYVIIDYGDD